MSVIDWQADLEKKVANLVRQFKAEVRAHDDEVVVQVSVDVTLPSSSDEKGSKGKRGKKNAT